MSISAKKINQMITDEFTSDHFNEENQDLLVRLAKDIYSIETSYEGGSDRRKIEEIQSKISIRSSDYKSKD